MNARRLYAFFIRLHPRRFRDRFGADMLWVFDESTRNRGAAGLLADVIFSLIRQWLSQAANLRRSAHDEADQANGANAAPAVGPNVLVQRGGITPQRYFMSGLWPYLFGQGILYYASKTFDWPGLLLLQAVFIAGSCVWFRRYRRKLAARGFSAPLALARLPRRIQLEDALQDIQRSYLPVLPLFVVFQFYMWNGGLEFLTAAPFAVTWALLMRSTDKFAARVLERQLDDLNAAESFGQ